MHGQQINSEALRSIGYDPERRVLEIEFEGGTVYRYFDVPASVHAGLMTAASHGSYFSDCIRDAGFDFERVN